MNTLEERLHTILQELEGKLQHLFGSHPDIATHIALAKAQVSANMPNPANTKEALLAEISSPTSSEESPSDTAVHQEGATNTTEAVPHDPS